MILIIFFLSSWEGDILQILRSDWFREQAQLSHPARSQLRAGGIRFVLSRFAELL